ncbi:hypothetical protein POKO110462_00860 [Pontibacter korlensis]
MVGRLNLPTTPGGPSPFLFMETPAHTAYDLNICFKQLTLIEKRKKGLTRKDSFKS